MNSRPPFETTPLARQIQGEILLAFEVADDVALSYAAELAALAVSWGDARGAGGLDWGHRVRKHLGGKGFKWRSEADRLAFAELERVKQGAYEALLPRRPH